MTSLEAIQTAETLGWVREPSFSAGYADNLANDAAEALAYITHRANGKSHDEAEGLAYATVYGNAP